MWGAGSCRENRDPRSGGAWPQAGYSSPTQPSARWAWRLPHLLALSGAPRLWRALGFEIWTEKTKISFPQTRLLHSFVHAASIYWAPTSCHEPTGILACHPSEHVPSLSSAVPSSLRPWEYTLVSPGSGGAGVELRGVEVSPRGDWLVVFSCEVDFGFRLRITPTLATHGKEDNWGLILCFLETPQGGERFSRP